MKNKAGEVLDTGFYQRRRDQELQDPEFRAEYERARQEIAQVDAVMRQLDRLREEAGCSKAELARRIGKNPASVRRLFTSEVNPELRTVAAMAAALGATIKVAPPRKRSRRRARAGAA